MDIEYNQKFYDAILPSCISCGNKERVDWICKSSATDCDKKAMGQELYCIQCKEQEHPHHELVHLIKVVFKKNAADIKSCFAMQPDYDQATERIQKCEQVLKYCDETFNKLKERNLVKDRRTIFKDYEDLGASWKNLHDLKFNLDSIE